MMKPNAMLSINDYVASLSHNQQKDFSDLLKKCVNDHYNVRQRLLNLRDRYTGDAAPIMEREFDDTNKINNKLVHNFMYKIVRTKVGYMFGKEATYEVDTTIDKEATSESKLKELADLVAEFKERNNMGYLDSVVGEDAAIYGSAYLLAYIDGSEKSKGLCVCRVNPWEVILIQDRSTEEVTHAIRYYYVELIQDGMSHQRLRVEFYDKEVVQYMTEDNDGILQLDKDEGPNPQPHALGQVPLIEFKNDEYKRGESERVLSLIDDYDNTRSDLSSEMAQLRMAYLAVYGESGPNSDEEREELKANLKQTGIFWFPETETRGEFLEKQLVSAEAVKGHTERLRADIIDIAGSVDMNDDALAGNLSGIAIKYKVTSLEQSCAKTEKLFENAFRRIFEIACKYWNIAKGEDYYLPNWVFVKRKRNLPVNVIEEADFLQKTTGLISKRTAFGQVSFIPDPDYEIELMKQEEADYPDESILPPVNEFDEFGNFGGQPDQQQFKAAKPSFFEE